METSNLHASKISSMSNVSDERANTAFSKAMAYAQFNSYGVTAMLLMFIGCLSGTTVGLVAYQYDLALIAVIIPTMLTLSLILSVQPIKYVLAGALVVTVVDLLILSSLLF
jgi:hypothetical protein